MNAKSEVSVLNGMSNVLTDVRRHLATELKLRQSVIKPLDLVQRALKDPHKNAVALHEATVLLEQPPAELALPGEYNKLVKKLRTIADENLSELEFTFARDLRQAFQEHGATLEGPPSELVAGLFVIRPDLRKKQVAITFSRQPVSKNVKLDIEKVVNAFQRAQKEICERKVDHKELLGELFEAYSRQLKLQGKAMGARISIVDCYRELVIVRQPVGFRRTPAKNSFVDYPKTHFAYDMLELRRKQQLSHDGHRLNFTTATIDVGSDTTRAMFLATGALQGQFVKDLSFEKGK
ncbi:MAG: hypothetical protein ACKV2V_00650 [Blastocatellia bacterium]